MSPSHIWAFAPRHARAAPVGHGARAGYGPLLPFPRSCLPLNELSLIDFTEADDPFALFELWLREAAAPRSTIPRRWRLPPSTPMGCPTRGWSCARAQTRAGSCSTPISRAPRVASSGASRRRRRSFIGSRFVVRSGSGRGGRTRRRGKRRLFRQPAEREPDRRLGEPAVAAARVAGRPRGGGRRVRTAVRRRRGAAARSLAGLPARAGRDRVLARPSLSIARTASVQAPASWRAVGKASTFPVAQE